MSTASGRPLKTDHDCMAMMNNLPNNRYIHIYMKPIHVDAEEEKIMLLKKKFMLMKYKNLKLQKNLILMIMIMNGKEMKSEDNMIEYELGFRWTWMALARVNVNEKDNGHN
ncbi:hypothetical protein V6N13_088592 [Hibiscus sabdariffa]|uniref:Uncharacterized protein n=1 Tax=Hibiscus sabdariffa TaxID=183260 RepID=A0ABR2FZT1_9ROSI